MQLTKTKISNQAQAIQYFIEKMDIEMVDAFLDNNKTYQDFEKYLFISKLQQAFAMFADLGDTHLLQLRVVVTPATKPRMDILSSVTTAITT